jgi:hypothetical protein
VNKHKFNKITAEGIDIRVQEGLIEEYMTYISYWMGTPPTPEEMEPKLRIRVEGYRMLAFNTAHVPEILTEVIVEREDGIVFLLYDLHIMGEQRVSGKHTIMENPIFICERWERREPVQTDASDGGRDGSPRLHSDSQQL